MKAFPMRALQFICAVFLTWIVGIESASARILPVWTMDEIADKAEVLLVGEIVEISAVEKIDADKTRWNTPLLRKAAKIRVLRAFKGSGAHAIQQEKQMVLVYEVADWDRGGGVSDGPFFREFAVGDVDRKSTRLNSSHTVISYAVFCLKKKTKMMPRQAGTERRAEVRREREARSPDRRSRRRDARDSRRSGRVRLQLPVGRRRRIAKRRTSGAPRVPFLGLT